MGEPLYNAIPTKLELMIITDHPRNVLSNPHN